MLTLIFVFKCDFLRCWSDFEAILERFEEVLGGQNGRENRFLEGFSENVDFLKIVVFPQENCYFLGFGPTNSMKIR